MFCNKCKQDQIVVTEDLDVGVGFSLKEVIGYSCVCDDTPMFTHDCLKCIFLGNFDGKDLYVHLIGEQTVIARFGDEGPEYLSGLPFSYGRNKWLTEARKRAENLGLLGFDAESALFYTSEDIEAQQELKTRLPFSIEYQAFLAMQLGDECRSEGIVNHLVSLKQAKPWNTEKTREDLLDGILQCTAKIVERVTAQPWVDCYLQLRTKFLDD